MDGLENDATSLSLRYRSAARKLQRIEQAAADASPGQLTAAIADQTGCFEHTVRQSLNALSMLEVINPLFTEVSGGTDIE